MTVNTSRIYNKRVALLTRSQFADAAHVSKPAVTKGIKAGHIVINHNGLIDTYEVHNSNYLTKRIAAADKSVLPTPKAQRQKQAEPESEPEASSSIEVTDVDMKAWLNSASLDDKKKLAQIELWHKQAVRLDIAILAAKEKLIPIEQVKKEYAVFEGALKVNLLDLARRESASLTALAISQGRQALESALEIAISEGLEQVIKVASEQGLS